MFYKKCKIVFAISIITSYFYCNLLQAGLIMQLGESYLKHCTTNNVVSITEVVAIKDANNKIVTANRFGIKIDGICDSEHKSIVIMDSEHSKNKRIDYCNIKGDIKSLQYTNSLCKHVHNVAS